MNKNQRSSTTTLQSEHRLDESSLSTASEQRSCASAEAQDPKPNTTRSLSKLRKDKAPIELASTVRAIGRTVNGQKMPHLNAIAYLRGLLAEHAKSKTVEIRTRVLDYFEASLAAFGRQKIEIYEVDGQDAGRFVADLAARKLASGTIRLYLQALGTLFAAAKKRKVVRRNVFREIRKPARAKSSCRRPFTEQELQTVCALADDEWFGMIVVAVYTGLRLADIARLVYRDVDLPTRYIRANVKKTKLFESKPIPPLLEAYFKALAWPTCLDSPIFPRAYGLVKADKLSRLSQQFVDLLIRAGVRKQGIKVRRLIREGAEKYVPLTFHFLRYNHTTMLKMGKAPEAVARIIAGHASVAVSDIYTHLGEDVTLAAVSNLPEIAGVSTYY
jgi:integrase